MNTNKITFKHKKVNYNLNKFRGIIYLKDINSIFHSENMFDILTQHFFYAIFIIFVIIQSIYFFVLSC
jgi:hypothetical protein